MLNFSLSPSCFQNLRAIGTRNKAFPSAVAIEIVLISMFPMCPLFMHRTDTRIASSKRCGYSSLGLKFESVISTRPALDSSWLSLLTSNGLLFRSSARRARHWILIFWDSCRCVLRAKLRFFLFFVGISTTMLFLPSLQGFFIHLSLGLKVLSVPCFCCVRDLVCEIRLWRKLGGVNGWWGQWTWRTPCQ